MPEFDEQDCARIARTVRTVEGTVRDASQRRVAPLGNVLRVPVILTSKLTEDFPAKARIQFPTNPNDPEDMSWSTQEEKFEIDVYPWAMTGKQVSSGQRMWVNVWGGRYIADVPEDCLEPRDMSDEEEEEE